MTMTKVKTISPTTLKNWLAQDKALTVLDIRPDNERQEWFIPQSTHFNVFDQLKSGDKHALDSLNIDKEIPVVTVCAGGNLSQVAAEILSEKGYDAYSLEGGMKAWNYAWDTSEIILEDVKIIQVRRLAKGCLSYLVGSGNQAMVIDASLNPSVYEELAKEQGWSIDCVSDTHIHADYVSRTRELAKSQGAKHVMTESAAVDFQFTPLKDGEHIKIGNMDLKILHTPGHTWESSSFLIANKVIFTGDTLFTDGVGRPDLKTNEEEAKNKAAALYDSLQVLLSLDKETLVMPAHSSEPIKIGQALIAASITEVKKSIQSLTLDKPEFISSILSKLPEPPPNYLTIATINKSGNSKDFIIADLEAGANHCAIK